MQLSYFDLLKKNDLTEYKLFIITGDEPLQKHNIIEKIIDQFKAKSYEISYHDLNEQNLDVLYGEVDSLSLFSMDKLIQFNFDKPPQKKLQQALADKLTNEDDNVYLLVFSGMKKQNLSAKWFQSLEHRAIHIRIFDPNTDNAINIIDYKAKQLGLTLTKPAIQLLVKKTEGNLIASKQIIKLLSRQSTQTYDENTIRPFIHEHASFDVFDLSEALLSQQKTKALKILNSILTENDKPPLVLWAIKRELRIISQLKNTQQTYHQKIFKDNNIWPSKQKFYISLANKTSAEKISIGLEKCLQTDLYIKGAQKGNIKLRLNEIVFEVL
ncbi:DNA polymerase III subunit delta [Francisella orientalis]|uniref:DNA polymerase III subunit delta n=2 Tax=Francisella orientalis TaxID=299583 RepID=A0AAP6X6A9_9GAMM|nr:DNA polymerase III subunit delta [Francisella orientalis]AFJ42713.1 DNA polymerase III, delta subunit [Francisella orientalis str. Toba 04]AHB97854.1 DNA polymerase III subunit delta [Francisella orientalis LADL 07-285A]AKN84955.1 DNA polymerase III, delta subunit [Francisella orientalis FNO12]AKN86493.1 DNA polymerase III, delta subunit [Francisella orientalis FNO24]AKN88031.1 DNA polymerase III, delta subunit [Francisella orientalis]